MKINDKHFLAAEAGDPAIRMRLLPGGGLMRVRRLLVLHFTAGASGDSSRDFWSEPAAKGASAQLIIDRDGGIIQVRPFDRTCGHAGVSAWYDDRNTRETYRNVNDISIGVEFANAGSDKIKWAMQQPGFKTIRAAHKHEPRRMLDWEIFPEAQILSGLAVCKLLCVRYNLDGLVGHEDIAPPGLRKHGDWKPDPGPAFPMLRFREHCGFSGLPVSFKP